MEERLKDFVSCYAKTTKRSRYIKNKYYKKKEMIKELCTDLKDALMQGEPLALVDTFAGLAQIAQYKNPDENGNAILKRMPVSYDTEAENCTGNRERDLVPNSQKKGIIYFEDNGGLQIIRNLSNGRNQYRGNIVLVCWLNRARSTGDKFAAVGKAAHDEIMAKFKGLTASPHFVKLQVKETGFRQDTSVFNKYSYDEAVLQFLRPPFEFFSINLTVTFITGCKAQVVINPNICETL